MTAPGRPPGAGAGATGDGYDAVVLAGGTGRRLGGAVKPDVLLHGRRLLDHALAATAGAGTVVVVAPAGVAVPAGVRRTLEDPPLGGPVAGIAAGLDALGPAPAPLVLVLACDVPGAAGAVPRLLDAVRGATGAGPDGQSPDGACLVDGAGREQWLVGAYRTAVLAAALAAGDVRGTPVRALARRLRLAAVPALPRESADVDTWEQLRDLEGEDSA